MKRNIWKLTLAFGILGLPSFASAQIVKALPSPAYVNPVEAAPAPRTDRMVSHQRTVAASEQPACTSAGCTTKDCTAAGGLPCSCGDCQTRRERCERGWWGSADYLMAWTKGRYVPALVTTSAPLDEGVLIPGNSTRVLYGDDENGTNMRSGGRIFAGKWLNDDYTTGFGVRFIALGGDNNTFSASSPGDPLLATPFFNADPLVNAPDAVIAASSLFPFPSGTIDVSTSNNVYSGEAMLRVALREGVDYRLDAIGGYHYTMIDDGLILNNTNGVGITTYSFHDNFNARNQFHGAMFGVMGEIGTGPWTAGMMAKLSVGRMYEEVVIDGSNTVDVGGNALTGPGGIFAQTTNMGTYKRDKIAYVPEITFNVNRRLTERLDFTVGYSFMYWSSVVLAGDQIDTTVDGGLFNSGAGNGVNRPSFTFRETEFFMHSLSLGMNFRF